MHKYHIPFKHPNNQHIHIPPLHSLHHLIPQNITNHTHKLLHLTPIPSQTPFYLSFINHDHYDHLL
ncbi:S-ribosylhomocysteine lyase, partial [Staphylococcus epidermidis]|uniref:S-ribosylhomocysteine lyase n=1 Tax=Staphylococcus epidermidis TaxID=1282 RepID=UPI0037D9AD77